MADNIPGLRLDVPDWPALMDGTCWDSVFLTRDATLHRVARVSAGRMVYLATPYSRRAVDERGRWSLSHSVDALAEAALWAGRCARAGISAFPPILVGAQIAHDEHACARPPAGAIDPLDAARWEAWCAPFLAAADAVAVPPMRGWDESLGVWRAVLHAVTRGRTVYLLEGAADDAD